MDSLVTQSKQNTSVKPGKFAVPENYSEENIEENAEPWIEDLEDDDVEIWFMQAPPSVDLSKIQGMPMKLSGKTYFDYEGLLGDKLESSAIPNTADSNKRPQFSLIAPSKEDKKFRVVNKPFAGHILLTESFEVPFCTIPEETNHERSDYPEKLKQKHHFGSYFIPSTESLSSPKKKKKKNKEAKVKSPKSVVFSSSGAEIENVLDDVENISIVKKISKHKASHGNRELDESSGSLIGTLKEVEMTNVVDVLEEDIYFAAKEKSKKKKMKREKHTEDLPESIVRKSASSTENSDIEKFKKPKLKSKIKIKEEPISSVEDNFVSMENVHDEIRKRKKKKKKKDYSTDDSTETLPNNETEFMNAMESTSSSQNVLLEVLDTDQEDSHSQEKVKKKKKKKKIKEEPMFPDHDESYDNVETVNTSIKEEEECDSYDSSSKSKSVKSSSKKRKSKDSVSKSSRHNERQEEDPDTTSVTKVLVQGKDYPLSEELLKALKSQKKEKRKKVSIDCVKIEPLSP